jgi:aminoglycoside 6'-N-acetyltransferase
VRLRAATPADAPYLAALAAHPDVGPFLSTGAESDAAALAAEIAAQDPETGGHVVFELGRPAGGARWERVNRRSRIASISRVVVDPALRGRGLGAEAVRALADELLGPRGFHRVQLEVYGFNEAALKTFERAGFTREGVRRRAYWRHGAWHDGVLFGRLSDDPGPAARAGDRRG